uniref:Uncharacterized protein n=1 Tax=Oryza sativa subsp. japonica TaxID=39947 RepID=Q5Z518_ORYSJ|nr:hypothetical protein [Oryza sativa Japonica Group]
MAVWLILGFGRTLAYPSACGLPPGPRCLSPKPNERRPKHRTYKPHVWELKRCAWQRVLDSVIRFSAAWVMRQPPMARLLQARRDKIPAG